MNTESRTKNSIRNAICSVLFETINILCSFVVRTIFIRTLSSAYLGLSGLFTNILSLLSLADLGFDTAIIYSLYKPIAENNKEQVAALMNYFKKVYNVVGFIILIIGMSLIPFMNSIVNLETDVGNIKFYYLLFLLNTCFTYFLANRVAIINADQKMYIVREIGFIFSIIQTILQIFVLIVYKNFTLYLIVQLLCTLSKNIYGAVVAKKMYPFLRHNKKQLSKNDKKDIITNIKSFMIYKIGGVILNDTDSILISSLILTEFVGVYSNYTIVILAINTLVNLFISSTIASIGNLNVKGSLERKEQILYRMKFLSFWVYGVCSICLLCLLNDFICIMWGTEYVMPIFIPLASVINFLICGLLHPFRLYRETTSAFRDIKYIYILTSIINLILSYILAKIMPTIELKLFGIIIATAIARLMTNYWVEPKKIINIVFNKSSKHYFKENLIDVFKICFVGFIVFCTMNKFLTPNLLMLLLKAIICFIITNLIFVLLNHKDENFCFFKKLLINMFLKKDK